MPGFAIHLAVAYEYLRKNNNDIIDKKIFIDGVIAPDLESDKLKSHYGNYGTSHIGLKNFIDRSNNYIKTDFGKGYFLHLVTDEAFYHKYFNKETKYIIDNNLNFYDDYDCTNKDIIKYFESEYIPENTIGFMKIKSEKSKILKLDKINKFINKLSNITLKEQVDNIKLKNEILV